MNQNANRTVFKNGAELRTGYTTGSCAAAASKAAALALLTGQSVSHVKISSLSGIELLLEAVDFRISADEVSCAVVKDAGDDPDATHGIRIYATVRRGGPGVRIDGGTGVGRVTRKGLRREVGQAAINPGPLEQISRELGRLIDEHRPDFGFDVLIWAPDGERVAEKTFNSRLGIVGGISILGTTGIVEPMSEASLIETIRLELKVRRESGADALLITPGNYGRDFARDALGLDIDLGVKCSNFAGEAFDYAAHLGFRRILLVGHAGKLVKLAAGVMNTHSRTADCRMETITAHAAMLGISSDSAKALMACTTTEMAIELLDKLGIRDAVFESILAKILSCLSHRLSGACAPEVVIFTLGAGIVAMTPGAKMLAKELM